MRQSANARFKRPSSASPTTGGGHARVDDETLVPQMTLVISMKEAGEAVTLAAIATGTTQCGALKTSVLPHFGAPGARSVEGLARNKEPTPKGWLLLLEDAVVGERDGTGQSHGASDCSIVGQFGMKDRESRAARPLESGDHDLGVVTGSQRRGVRYSVMARRPDPQLLPISRQG